MVYRRKGAMSAFFRWQTPNLDVKHLNSIIDNNKTACYNKVSNEGRNHQ